MKPSLLKIGLLTLILVFTFGFGIKRIDELKKLRLNSSTISISSEDGLNIRADIYEAISKEKPVILLFHQATYSRGEYLEIAPKLQKLGYTCISIDQRSGDKVNGIINETAFEAKKKKMGTTYPDAYPDLEAALKYSKEKYPNQKAIAWGSSYSSSLVFILASKYPDDIVATLSFSPGEYFKFEDKNISEFASLVNCPTFITSAKNEQEYWKEINESIPTKTKQTFLPSEDGQHGSKALWKENVGHEEYWEAIQAFLKSI